MGCIWQCTPVLQHIHVNTSPAYTVYLSWPLIRTWTNSTYQCIHINFGCAQCTKHVWMGFGSTVHYTNGDDLAYLENTLLEPGSSGPSAGSKATPSRADFPKEPVLLRVDGWEGWSDMMESPSKKFSETEDDTLNKVNVGVNKIL